MLGETKCACRATKKCNKWIYGLATVVRLTESLLWCTFLFESLLHMDSFNIFFFKYLRKERKLFDLSPASTPVSQENSTDNDSSTFACVTVSDEPRMWIYCEKALNIHWSENMRRNRMKVNSTACKMPTKVIFFCTFEYRSLDSIRWAAQHIRSDYCYYYLNISFFRNGNWLFDGFTERCRHHHPMQLVESNRKWKLNDERAADENQTTNEFLL